VAIGMHLRFLKYRFDLPAARGDLGVAFRGDVDRAVRLCGLRALFSLACMLLRGYIMTGEVFLRDRALAALDSWVKHGVLPNGMIYARLVADPSNQLPAITYWLMGSLSGVKLSDFGFVLIPMVLGCGVLLLLRWKLNLLTLGEEEARSLGVNTNLLRLAVILCSTLITAASIAVSGVIGWVGLVIPHLARKLVGSNYKKLLPAAMLLGASFLLLVDNVSRNLLATEIPIGILTAFIGAPFFIYLIMKREKSF